MFAALNTLQLESTYLNVIVTYSISDIWKETVRFHFAQTLLITSTRDQMLMHDLAAIHPLASLQLASETYLPAVHVQRKVLQVLLSLLILCKRDSRHL